MADETLKGLKVGAGMERRRFGSTKREVSAIGQGTWYIDEADRATAIAALRLGLDLGMTHIDTAEMYGSGAAEEMIAEAIAWRGEVFLSWGVSNFDVPDLAEVRKIAGKGHPACSQVLYHLGARAIEHAVIPWCEENGVAVVAYSPFGHRGALPGPRTAGGGVLKDIAAAHGATPHQVALRFLVRRPSLLAIPKACDRTARCGSLSPAP
jgi:diketogulonate reductase-like aldo/keto reductase